MAVVKKIAKAIATGTLVGSVALAAGCAGGVCPGPAVHACKGMGMKGMKGGHSCKGRRANSCKGKNKCSH